MNKRPFRCAPCQLCNVPQPLAAPVPFRFPCSYLCYREGAEASFAYYPLYSGSARRVVGGGLARGSGGFGRRLRCLGILCLRRGTPRYTNLCHVCCRGRLLERLVG